MKVLLATLLGCVVLFASGIVIGATVGTHNARQDRNAFWSQMLQAERDAHNRTIEQYGRKLADAYVDNFKSGESMGVALERARVAGCAEAEIPDGRWCNKRFYKMYVKKGVHHARPVVR